MSGLSAKMFTSTNYKIRSNTYTNQNQGGGDKKAGFPYEIGRPYGVSIALNSTSPTSGYCVKLNELGQNCFPLNRQSRPIGSMIAGNYGYYNYGFNN